MKDLTTATDTGTLLTILLENMLEKDELEERHMPLVKVSFDNIERQAKVLQ